MKQKGTLSIREWVRRRRDRRRVSGYDETGDGRKEGQIYCRGLVLKTIYQIGSVLKQIAGGSIIYVGAVIVTGVKLVTSLAITGTAMPPLAAAGRGGERRETRHWCWQDRKREETRHWH